MTECSSQFDFVLDKIIAISKKEPKTILEKAIKLQEELGELSEAILIQNRSSGSSYKNNKSQALESETVDIIIVALDIFFTLTEDKKLLLELLEDKSKKWEENQSK